MAALGQSFARILEAELYRFLSNHRRLITWLLIFYRPAPILTSVFIITGSSQPREFVYAMGTFYASFISLVFSIYRFPGRLSKDLTGPILFELITSRRYELFLARMTSTFIISTFLSFFPILSLSAAVAGIIGTKALLIAVILALSSSFFSLSSASLGLLFVQRRNPGFTLAATYILIVSSTALPYILYTAFHNPKYLGPLIVSPGFSPSIGLLFVLVLLGAENVVNDVRSVYASRAGKNPYYPGPIYGLMPSLAYLLISTIVFRRRFKDADL